MPLTYEGLRDFILRVNINDQTLKTRWDEIREEVAALKREIAAATCAYRIERGLHEVAGSISQERCTDAGQGCQDKFARVACG